MGTDTSTQYFWSCDMALLSKKVAVGITLLGVFALAAVIHHGRDQMMGGHAGFSPAQPRWSLTSALTLASSSSSSVSSSSTASPVIVIHAAKKFHAIPSHAWIVLGCIVVIMALIMYGARHLAPDGKQAPDAPKADTDPDPPLNNELLMR